MLVVLLSGVGLLGFALVSLWGSVRDADENQRRAALERARHAAKGLRESLYRRLFDEYDAASAYRFRVVDGTVQPAGDNTPVSAPFREAELPATVLELVRIARQQEFARNDPEAARRMLEKALSSEELDDRGRAYLEVVSAWQARRSKDSELLRRMSARLRQHRVLPPSIAASALLLQAGFGWDVERSWYLACGGLPEEETAGVLAMLTSKGTHPRSKEIADLVHHRRNIWRTVRVATEALPRLHSGATVLGVSRCVVVRRDNEGVVVPFEEVARRHRLHELAGLVLCGKNGYLPSDVVPVVEGLYGVQPSTRPQSFWTRPSTLLVLLILLAVSFGAGLFLSFRAIRRETAAMRERADFLTSVTHELKTPLSSIRLLAEMLEEGRVKSADKQQEYYGLLAGESARLTVLIENVLDLGRMERGERAYDRRPQRLDAIVTEAVELFEPLAKRDGMTVDLRPGAENVWGAIDSGALVQALLNVMENARKYAGSGGRLEISTQATADDAYRLTVRDHGNGIPKEEQQVVFQRFSRGREHRSGAVAGVGLGLYLSRAILRAHGGDLTCQDPAQGPGVEFVFSLPLRDALEEARNE